MGSGLKVQYGDLVRFQVKLLVICHVVCVCPSCFVLFTDIDDHCLGPLIHWVSQNR